MFETAIQFFFQGEHSERTNRISATGFKPRVFAEDEGDDGLFAIFDFGVNEAIGEVRAFFRGDPSVEQRHEHRTQLRLENVLEEFEGIVMNGFVL